MIVFKQKKQENKRKRAKERSSSKEKNVNKGGKFVIKKAKIMEL